MDTKESQLISRREAIKKAAMVFGGVISTPAALSILQGCSPTQKSRSKSFSELERATVETIADIIIPITDTPGATEAGAVQLLEDVLFAVRSEEEQNDFLVQLENFERVAKKELGTSFLQQLQINKLNL